MVASESLCLPAAESHESGCKEASLRPDRTMAVRSHERAATPALRVVEIVGPAGSGKTTLMRALKSRCPSLRNGLRLSKWELAPYYLASVCRLLPIYAAGAGQGRWLDRRELRAMAYVEAWRHHLKRSGYQGTTFFDHGPIFRLVRLQAFGPSLVAGKRFEAWWRAALAAWAPLLDAVVWLDAPDGVLADRIQSRPDQHRMKRESARDIDGFVSRYRACYQDALSALRAIHPCRLLEFRTDRQPAAEIADRVIEDLVLARDHEGVSA